MNFSGYVISCPQCRHSNPHGQLRCALCDSRLPSEEITMTLAGVDHHHATAGSGRTAPLSAGSRLAGRYEILQVLGEGGMGTVYKARDCELDRILAIKVIRTELAGNSMVIERFKRELLLSQQVTHRNVIRIFDLAVAGDLRFITMEYVDGRTLGSLMKERRFSVAQSIDIVMQVCRALSAAHAVHVIHRDLKPANIMMNDIGRVWVLDFGLARAAGMSGPGGLTMAGAVLGTPAYMSPEQAKGEPLDARSDLFALGIIFYELLTGELPYVAADVLTSVRMRTEALPPSPCKLNPSLPRALDRIVLKCLAPDPRKRHQSAAELLTELMAINSARPRGFTRLLSKVLRRRASAS